MEITHGLGVIHWGCGGGVPDRVSEQNLVMLGQVVMSIWNFYWKYVKNALKFSKTFCFYAPGKAARFRFISVQKNTGWFFGVWKFFFLIFFKIFFDKSFDKFFDVFMTDFLTNILFTNASFRIRVPLILFSYKIGKNRKWKF